jgi:hypothetical protein
LERERLEKYRMKGSLSRLLAKEAEDYEGSGDWEKEGEEE